MIIFTGCTSLTTNYLLTVTQNYCDCLSVRRITELFTVTPNYYNGMSVRMITELFTVVLQITTMARQSG